MKLPLIFTLISLIFVSCSDSDTPVKPSQAEQQTVSAATSEKVSRFQKALPGIVLDKKADFVKIATVISKDDALKLSDFVEICALSSGKFKKELGHLIVPCLALNTSVRGN